MKKIIYILSCAALCAAALPACSISACDGQVDYYDYVSELRSNIYIYEEDGLEFKIHSSRRETPYVSDGIKCEMNDVIEIYLSCDNTPTEVEVSVEGYGGEMNYLSVSKSFYLSFSGEDFGADKVEVSITLDGKQREFEAVSVLYDGVIDARTALDCVREYDGELFSSLTDGNLFDGEIYVRLLYDEGCFYYVGVCDKKGETNAYLLDGEDGRIIAKRTTNNRQS